MKVFVSREGKQYGPYDLAQINMALAQGRLALSDFCMAEDWPEWKPVSTLPGVIVSEPEPEPSMPAPPPPPDYEELVGVFVGKNYSYYARKWEEAGEPTRKSKFNWAAFFLGLGWMAYRKMYRNSLIYVAAIVLLSIWEAVAGDFPPAVSHALDLAIPLVVAMQANRWYRRHVEQKLALLAPEDECDAQCTERLARAGGTSLAAAIGVVVLTLVLILLVAWLTRALLIDR